MDVSLLRHIARDNVCLYDPRSLSYSDYHDPDEPREPRNGCSCDKCFYGQDTIAVAILDYLDGV